MVGANYHCLNAVFGATQQQALYKTVADVNQARRGPKLGA